MAMSEYTRRQLIRLITSLVEAGTPTEDIRIRIFEFMQANGNAVSMLDELDRLALDLWSAKHVISKVERRNALKLLLDASSQFAEIDGKINDEIVRIVTQGMQSGNKMKVIAENLESVFGTQQNHARTVARTVKSGYSRIAVIAKALDAGIEYFTYAGPSPERPFCIHYYKETLHIDEIRNLKNDSRQDAEVYCGGHNCTHEWQPSPNHKPENKDEN